MHGSGKQQEDADSAAACASAAASDAVLPAASRGLLQVAGAQPSLASPKAAATEGSWPSLLQGWTSRLSVSVLQAHFARAVDTFSLGIILVLACCLCCSGLYIGALHRDGSQAKSSTSSSATGASATRAPPRPAQQNQTRSAGNSSWFGFGSSANLSARQAARPQEKPDARSLPISHLQPEMVIPGEHNSILFLEFKEETPGPCQVELNISNHQGNKMFVASINRAAPGSFPNPKEPMVVLKKATGEGLARVFFTRVKDDRQAEGRPTIRICDMLQDGGPNSALLDVNKRWRDTTWTLRHGNPEFAKYTIEGEFSDTVWATVKNEKGQSVAEAGAIDGHHTAGKCRVCVGTGMDASLVLCSLLGIREIESHTSSPMTFAGT